MNVKEFTFKLMRLRVNPKTKIVLVTDFGKIEVQNVWLNVVDNELVIE